MRRGGASDKSGNGGAGSSRNKHRPSTASTSTSSRRRRSDSGRRREDLGVEKIDGSTKSKPRLVKGIQSRGRNSDKNIERDREPRRPKTCEDAEPAPQSYKSNKDLDRDKPVTPEQKACFEEFSREALNKGIQGILDEYTKELAPYIPPGMTRKAFDANPQKNRYGDVVCIDQTRVILKHQMNDYIHANYVQGYPLLNIFICTQGPTMGTVKDFWRMISQEQVGNIIMLCDTIEMGKDKCTPYWPREEGCAVEWPGIQVKNTKVDTSDTTTVVSNLEVVIDKKERFILKHHHWRSWPDKSVPQSVLAPFRLLKSVRHSQKPTVVHCSAGIGRTGSVVALEVCYQQLLCEQNLSVLDMVRWLRQQRMHSVQTDLQYVYLFKCLLFFASKNKLVPPEMATQLQKFDEEYQRLIDERNKGEKKELYAPLVPSALRK
uniref:Protein-tyrosine-phosphatase n=1 Tax=Panagrellus redivivus TaxID=6233 RepID=A0A7E4ZRU5_PANRE